MIKAILLDLDDTLISSQINLLLPAYLQTLGAFCKEFAPPEEFIRLILATYDLTVNEMDPRSTLYARFMKHFAEKLNTDSDKLEARLTEYYATMYSHLRGYVTPRAGTEDLLRFLWNGGYQTVVATNPALPEVATRQRMDWGGLTVTNSKFDLITTLETMHFGKPHPEYYEEIMGRLDRNPGEALMVGDDWENDILPAQQAGLATFWITEDCALPIAPDVATDFGTFAQFVDMVTTGWLNTLAPQNSRPQAFVHRLRAFPAGLAPILTQFVPEVLECRSSEQEWSARDILCHLRDHESNEDRRRLKTILEKDNPFLSGNYDPWAFADTYSSIPAAEAFEQFAHEREITVQWLQNLPEEVWSRRGRHAVFGPTTFEEMVRFTTEHDISHARQIRRAIEIALRQCA